MRPEHVRYIQVGDLLYLRTSTVIWADLAPDENGYRSLEGHQNIEHSLWCTVVDVESELNMEACEPEHHHFTKVWLHKPIWGSYTGTIVTFGWLWTSACHRAINLHKS